MLTIMVLLATFVTGPIEQQDSGQGNYWPAWFMGTVTVQIGETANLYLYDEFGLIESENYGPGVSEFQFHLGYYDANLDETGWCVIYTVSDGTPPDRSVINDFHFPDNFVFVHPQKFWLYTRNF